MITISVLNKTDILIDTQEITSMLSAVFKNNGIASDAEVSVVFVNRDEMLEYVKTYLKEEGEEAAAHPVLSFVQSEVEGPFQFPPDNIIHLGEIIVSVDHASDEAKNKNISLTEAVCDLAEHSALHLLGIHHD